MSSRTSHRDADTYERHFEESALFEFTRVVNSSLDLRFVLNHTLLTIMGKLLTTRGMVLLTQGRGTYRVEVVKGFPHTLSGKEFSIPRLPRSPIRTDAPGGTSHRAWLAPLIEEGVSLVLPLFSENRPVGLLAFGSLFNPRALARREVSYLRSLADLSGTAIAKSHMIDELQQVNRELDRKIHALNTLYELGKEFSAVLDTDRVVKLLVLTLMGQVGVTRHLVALREGADMRIIASRVDGSPPQGELLASLLLLRRPAVIDDMIVRAVTDPRPVLRSLGLALAVPMSVQGEPKGLLLLGEKMNREPFRPDDLDLIVNIGNAAMVALENARLFREAIEKQKMEDELQIAREIQKGLLPNVLPEIPGVALAATNISSKQVGGDYYDVLSLPDGKYVLAIGDVSGKGTPAALLMANLQATIRALVPLHLGLPELTSRVNDLLCQNTGGTRFVTFFWGMLDSRARTLTYVNAGHNYPYLIRSDGREERLERGGMILGVMPAMAAYEEVTVELRSGDLLVLFTDGVSEAMNREGVEYGEPRLERVLRSSRGRDAAGVIAAIQEDILLHTNHGSQSDDITMMVARFT